MDDIKFSAGPVVGRYNEKMENERQARREAEEAAAAKKRAEEDARKKAEEAKKGTETPKTEDAEMKDADTVKPDGVEEPSASK